MKWNKELNKPPYYQLPISSNADNFKTVLLSSTGMVTDVQVILHFLHVFQCIIILLVISYEQLSLSFSSSVSCCLAFSVTVSSVSHVWLMGFDCFSSCYFINLCPCMSFPVHSHASMRAVFYDLPHLDEYLFGKTAANSLQLCWEPWKHAVI